MDADLRQAWLDALRSGDYKQAQGRLVVDDSEADGQVAYCCLGVLCHVAERHGLLINDDWVHGGDLSEVAGYTEYGDEIDLASILQTGPHENDESTCISMNDSQDKSFDEIADTIEARGFFLS